MEPWAESLCRTSKPDKADRLQAGGHRGLLTSKQADKGQHYKVWCFIGSGNSPRLRSDWTRRQKRTARHQQPRSAGPGAEAGSRQCKQDRPAQPQEADNLGNKPAARELSLSHANRTLEGFLPSRSNVAVRWRRNQATFVLVGLLRKLLSCLQQLVAVPANPYLQGNYAPCAEVAPTQLEVEGKLPRELDGAYIRNGPNPVLPATGKCNWVDGDGMLHACTICDGKVTYSSHQIRTAKLEAELQHGHAFHLKIGDVHGVAGLVQLLLHSVLILIGSVNLKKGVGTANTSVILHNGRLQALQETDSPYEIELSRNGAMRTLGRVEIEGRLRQAFTAHPKLDERTGELFYFDYNLLQKPLVSMACLDQHGHLMWEYPMDAITSPNLMHDFALTENYIVLYEAPMKLDIQHMIHCKAGPFRWQPYEPTRLWLLDRKARSSAGARCYTIQKAMNFMHTGAAFELGSRLYIYATVQTHFDMASADGTHLFGHQKRLPNQPQLYQIQLDLDHHEHDIKPAETSSIAIASTAADAARTASGMNRAVAVDGEHVLVTGHAGRPQHSSTCAARFSLLAPEYSSDMPVSNKAYFGLKTRFIYAATLGNDDGITFTSLLKYDLEACPGHMVVGQIDLGGPDCLGGEPAFVSMDPETHKGKRKEDAGYLVLYVHDIAKHETWLVVYNAQTFSSKPVARAKIPSRVPFGFHGIHVSEKELSMQPCWAGSQE